MNSVAEQLSAAKLALQDIPTARLESLVLLEDLTNKDRSWLLAHPEFELSQAQIQQFKKALNRRAKHEPLSYIRGKSEFYGREFRVSSHTLEPRPETETMIDCLKKLHAKLPTGCKILDVGTGSGAIGITVALELKHTNVDLIDIDKQALKIARDNCRHYDLSLDCFESDLLDNTKKAYDVLLANLPYVPDEHTINQAAMQEPAHAIFGGPDGLDLYRRLFEQATSGLNSPTYILTESLPFQHEEMISIAKKHGYKLILNEDFILGFELRA